MVSLINLKFSKLIKKTYLLFFLCFVQEPVQEKQERHAADAKEANFLNKLVYCSYINNYEVKNQNIFF